MFNRGVLTKSLFVVWMLLFVTSSYGSGQKHIDATMSRLEKRKHRPSIQEVVRAFGGKMPSSRAMQTDRNSRVDRSLAKSILAHMPMAIAKLELVYPGAVWATLGRDAVAIADILESFYFGMGQRNRVVRINASTDSFQSSSRKFIQMLTQLGLNIDRYQSARPFVVLDRTGYSEGSQSTQLMEMVYSHFSRLKQRHAKELVDKVGVVSSSSGTTVSSVQDARIFIKQNRDDIETKGHPPSILQVSELAHFTDKSAWHDSFGELVTYTNGRIGGEPGYAMDEDTKHEVLREMFAAYYTVQTVAFQNKVREAAKSLGYDFDERMKLYANSNSVPDRTYEIEDALDESLSEYFSDFMDEDHSLYPYAKEVQDNYREQILLRYEDKIEELRTKRSREAIVRQLDSALKTEWKTVKPKGSLNSHELLFMAFVKTLPKITEHGSRYFSENGKRIKAFFDAVQEHWPRGSSLSSSYIALVVYAHENKYITSKDFRRLVLYALASFQEERNLYKNMKEILEDAPALKAMMVRHAKVFLTSGKNEMAGRTVYLNLIEKNILPKPRLCDAWLKATEEDEED